MDSLVHFFFSKHALWIFDNKMHSKGYGSPDSVKMKDKIALEIHGRIWSAVRISLDSEKIHGRLLLKLLEQAGAREPSTGNWVSACLVKG